MNLKKPMGKYFYKLLLFFIIVSFIPLTIIGFFISGFSNESYKNIIYEQTNNYVLQVHERIDRLIEDYDRSLSTLYQDEQIKKVLLGELSKEESYQDIYEKIYYLMAPKKNKGPAYIINTEGELIFGTHPWTNPYDSKVHNNWGIFRKAIEAEGETVLYAHKYLDPSQNSIVLSMARAIFVENICVGYIIIDIPRTIIADILSYNETTLPFDMILIDQHQYVMINLKNPNEESSFLGQKYQRDMTKAHKDIYWNMNSHKPYLFLKHTSSYTHLETITLVSLDMIIQNNRDVKELILWAGGMSLFICLAIAWFLARNIAHPINELVSAMEDVEKGNLAVRVEFDRRDEIGMLGKSFNHMVERLKLLMNNLIQKQRKIRKSEVKLLQAQINPHFLYNALDSIKWMAKLNQMDEVTHITTHLGKLLRHSINIGDEFTTVEDSFHLIESYLYIQKVRLGDKLKINMYIEEKTLNYRIPKLILQPLVENAILHGFEEMEEECLLEILGYEEKDHIILQVMDNGKGIEEKEIENLYRSIKTDEHIGLYNVDQRVKLYYGRDYGVDILPRAQGGTKATLRIPKEIKDEEV